MIEPSVKIWLGRGVSNHAGLIDWIRSHPLSEKWTIAVSHYISSASCLQIADEFWLEKQHLSTEEYCQFVLQSCIDHHVTVFIPGREFIALDTIREKLKMSGTEILLPATGNFLACIENKKDFYARMKHLSCSGPDFISFSTSESFESAYSELSKKYETLCSKPSVAIFAQGFRVIHRDLDYYQEWLSPSLFRSSLEDIRRVWSSREFFPEQLLMEYLEGTEWSIDCFRNKSGVLAAIPRYKSSLGHQEIRFNKEIVTACEHISQEFELTGLFNIQCKLHQGIVRTLEINPRLSGGVAMARFTGNNLPVMAISEILGLPIDPFTPFDPILVNKTDHYFEVKQ